MPVVQQFNPSTLKAIYNPATKKAQVAIPPVYGDGCEWCPIPAQTPKHIQVTFSGVLICDNCSKILWPPGNPDRWGHFSFNINPNKVWLLTQTEEDPCIWLGSDGNALHIDSYLDSDCTILEARYNDDLVARVMKTIWGTYVDLNVLDSPGEY